MSRSECAPKSILATSRHHDRDCPLIMTGIYNQKTFLRNLDLYGRTTIELLLNNFHASDVLHAYQRNAIGQITHLFIVPTNSAELIQGFPDIILIDSAYKKVVFACLYYT